MEKVKENTNIKVTLENMDLSNLDSAIEKVEREYANLIKRLEDA